MTNPEDEPGIPATRWLYWRWPRLTGAGYWVAIVVLSLAMGGGGGWVIRHDAQGPAQPVTYAPATSAPDPPPSAFVRPSQLPLTPVCAPCPWTSP